MIFILPFLDMIDDPDDRAFFEKLITENEHLFIQIAYSKFQDYGYAEDACSEMYLYIALNFDKIKNRTYEEAKSYMCYVVGSKARAIRLKVTKETLFDELPPEIYDPQNVEDEYFERFDKEMLVESICEINEKFKEALIYKFVFGLKSNEIGDIVGAHAVTVRRRMLYGKAKLKKILERKLNEGVDDGK